MKDARRGSRAGLMVVAGLLSALANVQLAGCKQPEALVLRPATPGGGKTIVLDAAGGPEGDTGWWPQVAFDAHDRPHIAFCDAHHGDVRYATEVGGAWRVTSVVSQGAVGKYIAMDLDSHGHPGIAFYDQDKMYLRYAWQDAAGHWQDEQVAWGREAGMGDELRFDPQDRPHLFYYLASGKLIHAVKQADGWHKEVLRDAAGVYSVRLSAVARPDGVWLSYVDWKMRDAALFLGHLAADGSFHSEQVSNQKGPGWHSQLLFVRDVPYIVASHELTKKTAVVRPDGQGGWTTALLVSSGSTFAARPLDDGAIVAYQDTADLHDGAVLRYARTASLPEKRPWEVRRIDDDGPVGGYVNLAVSRGGRLLVAYYADAARSLKLYDEMLRPP